MRILAVLVIVCTLLSVGCTSEKPDEASNYDAGIEAYKRGHYTTALYDFEKRANQGDPVAQFCLGYMYKHGHGVRANNEKAAKWYIKAADQGYAPAMNNLAKMYVNGHIDSKSETKIVPAKELWKQAAKKGNRTAQINLGYMYLSIAEAADIVNFEDPVGFVEDPEELLKGTTSQLPNLKEIEEYLRIEKTDELSRFEEIEKLLKGAASQELPRSLHFLGNLYSIKAEDAADAGDFELANELYKMQENSYKDADNVAKAKEKAKGKKDKDIKGYAPAQYALGSMYYKGEGVAQSLTEKQKWEEALIWYTRASEQNHDGSQFALAVMYRDGRGVDPNPKKAMELFRKAAEQGNISAQNPLANIYADAAINPNLFEQNGYRFGAHPDDKQDNERKAKLYREMASRWYLRAAQQGEAFAQVNLGRNFEIGRNSVSQDNAEAYYWYGLALTNKEKLKDAVNKDLVTVTIKARERAGDQLNNEDKKNKIQEQVNNWRPKQLVSSGTGFYIHKNYILTNAHVVTKDDDMKYEFDEFRIPYRRVELIAWDSDVDLALLYDERGNTNTATFRYRPVYWDEKIVSFGYPKSHLLSYEGNSTSGTVSGIFGMLKFVGLKEDPHPENYFQHTAPIQGGNSGGPVFDLMGYVVGVTKYGMNYSYAENVNFAIKFNVIKEFLEDNGFKNDFEVKRSSINDKEQIEKIYKVLVINTNSPFYRANVSEKAKEFTVPVLCFKNKEEKPFEFDDSIILDFGIHDLKP